MSAKARRDSGMSLVDVLMSMFLLSLAFVGLTLAFPPAYLAVFQERTVTHAVTIAAQRIEEARRQATVSGPGPKSYATLEADFEGTEPVGPYTVVTSVTPDDPAANFTRINVSVTGPAIVGPNTPNMGPQNVVVETFIAAP
ncbi:MAG: type IV pilus modification PilV family protein [Candidatus Rokuibacteriota bacterium]